MIDDFRLLFHGCPVVADRGYLGWSTVAWFRIGDRQILFDTGWFGDRPMLQERLRDLGSGFDQIDLVVLSHLHFDHMANAELFTAAEIWVSEPEWAYARKHALQDLAIPAWSLSGLEQCGRLRLVNPDVEVASGLRLLPTPGHTDGHVSAVFTWQGDLHVLTGDAIKSRADLLEGAPTGPADEAAGAKSRTAICAAADIIIPGHDVPLYRTEAGYRPLHSPGEVIRSMPGILPRRGPWRVEV
jgi:N-acyl homoserine lactone hydrolase